MPRGRKRNQRSRGTQRQQRTRNLADTPYAPQGESQRSKAYTEGRAVKYAYRIHGPTYPVTTLTAADLPEGSTLR